MKSTNASMVFVNAAICTDTSRYYMCDAYWDAEKKRIVSTDGRRLHIWNLSEGEICAFSLPEKACYVKLMPKEDMILVLPAKDYQFPNIDRVTPDKHDTMTASFQDKRKDFEGRFLVSLYNATGALIALEYLKPLIGQSWRVSASAPDKALRFDSDALVGFGVSRFVAVIMPVDPDEAHEYVKIDVIKAEEAPDKAVTLDQIREAWGEGVAIAEHGVREDM